MAALVPEIGQTVRMWGKSPYAHPGANLGTGNRCGHKPDQFAADRLALPKVKGGHLPSVLKKGIKRALEFFEDPDVMSRLGYHRKRNKDGSFRKVRSERRETEVLVLHAVLSGLDLASLRVGFYRPDGSFRNFTCDELAARVGLTCLEKNPEDPENPRTVASSRWWRGFSWLKEAAGLEVFEQYEEKADGSKRGRPAIKTMDERFLRLLTKYPKQALFKARQKVYAKVKAFVNSGYEHIQTVQEREELERGLDASMGHTRFYRKVKPKNQEPKVRDATSPQPAGSHESRRDAYAKHQEEVMARMIEAEGRHPGGRQAQKLWAHYGGLSFSDFEAQHYRQ